MARRPLVIHCPAGEFTRVEYFVLPPLDLTKVYFADPPDVDVRFRITGIGIPPLQTGHFTNALQVSVPSGVTAKVKFNPAEDIDVTSEIVAP
jgi:hypothetical protein